MTLDAQGSAQPNRRDLDVIGIFVVGGLVVLHTAQIFAPVENYIKNAPPNFEEPSQLVAVTFMAFFTLWGMPLMFFIAGMSVVNFPSCWAFSAFSSCWSDTKCSRWPASIG